MILPAHTKDKFLAANLNSPFTRTLANNSGLVEIQLTYQKSLLTL